MVKMLRQIAVRTLTFPAIVPLVQRWNRDLGLVFMLHRMADHELGIPGQDPEALRRALALLRRHRFRIVPLSELLGWATSSERQRGPCIAFTLDDGYLEQATRAAPIFAEFDVPATIFPVSGFLDGELWMWWDRLRFLVDSTERRRVSLPELGPSPASLDSPTARSRLFHVLSGAMKRLPVAAREERLIALSGSFDVELPTEPPRHYAPMSWEQARRCEAAGIGIGPHTVTHPTLSQESEDRVRGEVQESWARLREEMEDPVPIFCYPNGCQGDFGGREAKILEEMGLQGALTAEPGYLDASGGSAAARRTASPYELPRYSFPDLHSSLVRVVSGLSTDARRAVSDSNRRAALARPMVPVPEAAPRNRGAEGQTPSAGIPAKRFPEAEVSRTHHG